MAERALPLDPDARSTLRDVLTPPDGYSVEQVLGTAYSLDAETLVTIPLFAAGIGAAELEKSVGIARIYELGPRITLLVQGDRIAIQPRWAASRPLLKLLGDAVVPCSIQSGSFHPKLLVLKFQPIDGPGESVFRIVVATRNLTTDNAWDSVVVLDQAKSGTVVPGLGEAVSDLAQFVNDPAHPAVDLCVQLGRELEEVCFQPLKGITHLEVRLLHPGNQNAAELLAKIKGDDLLVISPFVRKQFLEDLAANAGAGRAHRWLVTRPVDVPTSAFADYQVFQIADAAVPAHEMSDEEHAAGSLVGLHAKIYVASSRKGGTRIVVTSANATPSGWRHNVEIAMTGLAKSKALQVPALLALPGQDQERTFGSLLDEISPSAITRGEQDPKWVRAVRRALAEAVMVGQIRNGPPRTLDVTIELPALRLHWSGDVAMRMHPFGYSDRNAVLMLEGDLLRGNLEIAPGIELTPFAVLTLTHRDDAPLEIVLAMRLAGDIDWDRKSALATLARSARPALYEELLWHFGVKGQGKKSSGERGGRIPARVPAGEIQLPILEKVLLRVHGPNSRAEVDAIDNLLAGLTDDPGDQSLAEMWRHVKESLR